MTKLAGCYGAGRVEAACAYLLSYTMTPSIRTLSTILKNGQERSPRRAEPEKTERMEQHGITCGADYFRKGGVSRD